MIAVFALVFVSFWTSWILEDTAGRWARHSFAPGYSYQLKMSDATYYLSPGLGWYLDHSLWLHFGGLALFFLIPYLLAPGGSEPAEPARRWANQERPNQPYLRRRRNGRKAAWNGANRCGDCVCCQSSSEGASVRRNA